MDGEGGANLTVIARARYALNKFHELSGMLTRKNIERKPIGCSNMFDKPNNLWQRNTEHGTNQLTVIILIIRVIDHGEVIVLLYLSTAFDTVEWWTIRR